MSVKVEVTPKTALDKAVGESGMEWWESWYCTEYGTPVGVDGWDIGVQLDGGRFLGFRRTKLVTLAHISHARPYVVQLREPRFRGEVLALCEKFSEEAGQDVVMVE